LKKVVVIGPAYPLRGGIAAYTQRLAQQFVQDRVDTKVYTFSLQYPSFLFPGKTQFSSDAPPADLEINVCINSINPLNWLKVGKEIRKLNPDAVVFNYWLPLMGPCYGTIARMIRKNPEIAVLAVIHNMIPHEKRAGDQAFSRYFINACTGFLTMTKKVEDDLQLFTSSTNKALTPHPVYDNYGEAVSSVEAAQHLHLDTTNHYILFFGLVRKYKGLDLLMKALSDPRLKGKNITLLVAGEFYDDRNFYDQLAEELKITVKVVSDFIPDEEVKYYFSIADLVVLPYRNATQSGVSSLAIHFDKPMIVSNFGGLPDAVINRQTGYVVEAEPSSIADAIHQFYSLANSSQMVDMVKQEKQKYSWSKVVNELIRLAGPAK